MILYQGPVTGPGYMLARALASGFPIIQDGFQHFKWVDMILYQGPVTGSVYMLAPALVSGFPIFQDGLFWVQDGKSIISDHNGMHVYKIYKAEL